MPDAATNTPLIEGLAPLARLGAPTMFEILKTDDLKCVIDKLPIEAVMGPCRAVSKEFEELCDDRARPVERLRDAYGGLGDELSLPQILRARWLLGQGQNVEGDLSYQGAWHDFVHVSDAYLGDDGLKRLAKALSNGAFPRLMFMCLGGNEIGDEGLSALGEAAANGGLARLFDLVLDDNRIGNGGLTAFCNPSSLSPMPRTPELRTARVPVVLCPMLEYLCLNRNPIGDDGAFALAQAIERGNFPKLHTIEFTENTIGGAAIEALKKALPPGGEIKQKDRLEYYRRTSADAELVARQTGVSHDQAAMALEANDGDIVRAIIELTT